MKTNNDLTHKEINDKFNLPVRNMIYDTKLTVEKFKTNKLRKQKIEFYRIEETLFRKDKSRSM